MAPRYAIQGVPMMQKQTGPLGTLGNFAMQKGLQYGINAAVPGGGIAAEAAQAVLPGMVPRFNMGGKAPLGASQKGVKELEEARRLGALTRDEYLKALGHMNKAPQYKEDGGETESNWAKLMRQWKEMKEATEAADIAGDMARIGAALETPTGQQQALQAVLPLFKSTKVVVSTSRKVTKVSSLPRPKLLAWVCRSMHGRFSPPTPPAQLPRSRLTLHGTLPHGTRKMVVVSAHSPRQSTQPRTVRRWR